MGCKYLMFEENFDSQPNTRQNFETGQRYHPKFSAHTAYLRSCEVHFNSLFGRVPALTCFIL